jgi:YD repeat-containing protein
VDSGKLTLSGGTDTGSRFTVAAGSVLDLTGAQNATLTGTYTGSGSGVVQISGGTVTVGAAGATLNFPAGQLQWTGGWITGLPGSSLTIASGSMLILSGPAGKILNTPTVTNDGTIADSGAGTWSIDDGMTLANAGLIDFQGDEQITPYGVHSVGTIKNTGTVQKSAGTGSASLDVIFNNGGTVTVQQGALSLTGGSIAGMLSVAAGATIDFSSGTTSLDSGTLFNGGGLVKIAGGTVNITANITGPQNLELDSGTLSAAAASDLTLAGSFTWNGGTITGPGTVANPSGSTLTLSGSAGKELAGATLANAGTIAFSGAGPWAVDSGATLDNAGRLDFQGDEQITTFGAHTRGTINNTGMILKSAGTGSSSLDVIFNNGGTVDVESGTVTLGSGTDTGGNFQVGMGATLDLTGGTCTGLATFNAGEDAAINIPGGTYSGGVTFNAAQNVAINLTGGAFTGGITSSLGQGAIVNLTGGHTVTYGGMITGSGAGTVQFSSGTLYPAIGGVTLNFPGNMFQWTGGSMELSVGDMTNKGTINLSGSNQTEIYDDGTLYDYGTIIQSGSGDFGLHSDGVSPTTLIIEPGGSYLIESNAGIKNLGNTTAITNAGTIRKIGGMGDSTISVVGQLVNTGTIEVASGTLSLSGTLAQVSKNTLTGGTWNAIDGATLQFPSGAQISSNEGDVSLGGAGATIAALSGLASNSGSLSLAAGARLTTRGDFSNNGALTLGPDGTLTVAGGYTQTSAGTLNEQIGGTPASGLFGQLDVSGTATLAGTFNLTLVNGFAPQAGVAYAVLAYGQLSGSFTTVTGLNTDLTVHQGATSLDLVDGAGIPEALAATGVTAPTTATQGQQITISWQVTNQGSNAATGTWQDSVYLSTTSAITSSSTFLGSVRHTTGLGAGDSYRASLTEALPGVAPGPYYVLVEADSLNQQSELDRALCTMAATTGQLEVSLPALNLGTATNGAFTAADQDQYYQVSVPAGGALVITLVSSASSGATALYVGQGVLPTPSSYAEAAKVANQPNQTVTVPQVLTAGTYYILAHSVSGAASTAGYTLTATRTGSVAISAISSYAGGNTGNVTVEIDGTNFTPSTSATLTLGSSTLTATAVDFVSSSQLFATFDLSGAAAGAYTLGVKQGSESETAPTTFSVVASSPGALNVSLSAPQYVRAGRTGTIVISYSNPTSNDMVAPLLDISSTNTAVLFSTPDDPNNYKHHAQVLAVATNGPAGILRPGQGGQLTLTLLDNDAVNNDKIPLQVGQIEAGQTIDWASEEASLRPSSIPTAAWNVIFGNVLGAVGTTTDSYNAALAQAATYLGSLGETTAQVSDVGSLWSFRVAQANASFPAPALASAVDASVSTPGSLSLAIGRTFVSTIAGRYTAGIFGLGWTTPWQSSLSVDSTGNTAIDSGGSLSFFGLQPSGNYVDTNGEYGTLTLSAGIYTFTNTAGTQYVFYPPGTIVPGAPGGDLNYVQDTNGNRITLGYNASKQLVTLTYSNPADPSEPSEQVTLAYDTTGPNTGLVETVTDGTGNTWTYSYDSADHLVSVTSPGTGPSSDPGTMTTSYSYGSGNNPETANALLSITSSDGAEQTFTYDPTTGRLTGTAQPDGDLTIATTYSYLGQAEVMATDTAGDQTTLWFNELGLAARVEDPKGNVTSFIYDNNGNPLSYTDAAGGVYRYSYDSAGNLTQIVNPLGQTDNMTYGPLSELTSLADADGNTTRYNHDSAGNLLSITYPDGTQ